MKKAIIKFLCFLFLSFQMLIIPTIADVVTLKKGFYKVDDLNLSPDTAYTIQNTSFNERIYILIFDAHATPLQGLRLRPQSSKYNLIPLQHGYKFVLIGDGEAFIS